MSRCGVFFLLVLVFSGWIFQVPLAATQPRASAGISGAPGGDGTDPGTVFGNWSAAAPVTGSIKLLVVAVDFKDVKHVKTTDELSTAFFGAGSSLSSYFREVSYGKFIVTGTVVGWYNLDVNMAYYGADGNSIDNSRDTIMPQSLNMILDAQDVATKSVAFTNYNYLMVLHAGDGQETSKDTNKIWSVAFTDLHEYSKMIFKMAAVVPEEEDQGVAPLGVWVHEFSHLLGLPDIYQGHKRAQSSSQWDLMDYGAYNGKPLGSMPAEWSAWSRLKVGWLPQSSVKEMTDKSSELVLVKPLEEATDGYRAVNVTGTTAGESDYYVIEVRRPTGYDKGLPDQGVVVWRIRESPGGGSTMAVVNFGGDVSALHHGASYSSGDFAVKVVAAYPNGDCLIGLGDASNTPTQVSITLLVSVFPVTNNMTITVDGQKYVTDASGQISVTNVSATNSTTFTIIVPDMFDIKAGARLKFVNWGNNASSTTLNLPVTNSATITVNYKMQYSVVINSQYGNPKGGGWYDARTPATISVTTPVSVSTDTRYVFQGWTGDFTGTNNPSLITVVSPMNITASWTTQYLLAIDDGGKANQTEGQGWYNDGTLASFTLISPAPGNGTWYVFHGWTGDFTGLTQSGTITMNKPMVITAVWLTMERVSFNYVTGLDGMTPVLPARIKSMQLTTPNGTTQTVDPMTQDVVWLESGQYSVISVLVFGVNTAYGNQTFTTAPDKQINIRLELYDLTFDVRDMLFSTPIKDASINVTLPDGTVETVMTQDDGKAQVAQLPRATYPYKVTAGWAMDIKGQADILGDSTVVPVRMVVIISIAIVTAIAIAAMLGLIFFLRRKGGGAGLPGLGMFRSSGQKKTIMANLKGEDEGEQAEESAEAASSEESPEGTESVVEVGATEATETREAEEESMEQLAEQFSQSTERSAEQSTEQLTGQFAEQSTERSAEQSTEQPAEQSLEEPSLERSFAGTEADPGNAEDRLLRMLRKGQQP